MKNVFVRILGAVIPTIIGGIIVGIIVLFVEYNYFTAEDRKPDSIQNEQSIPKTTPPNTPSNSNTSITHRSQSSTNEHVQKEIKSPETWSSKYLQNPQIANNPSQIDLAIFLRSTDNTQNQNFAFQIGNVFREAGFAVYPSFFSSKFSDDKLDLSFINGGGSRVLSQELSGHIDRLVIASYEARSEPGNTFSQIEGMEKMTTVQLEMNFYDFSTQSGMLENSYTLSTSGIDVRPSDAEEMAMKRLLGELSKKLQ